MRRKIEIILIISMALALIIPWRAASAEDPLGAGLMDNGSARVLPKSGKKI